MAVDVSDIGRQRDNSLAGDQDTEIVNKMMVIAGTALVVLVALKLGFLKRVLP
jgi:hypothetical protein